MQMRWTKISVSYSKYSSSKWRCTKKLSCFIQIFIRDSLSLEGEAAVWRPRLSVSSCKQLQHPSHTFPLSAVHEASSGSTAWVFLLSLTSVIPPLIQQSVVLKSRSLLELGEVFLSSPYKLLILSQYCKVTWDMTVLTIKEVIISFKCWFSLKSLWLSVVLSEYVVPGHLAHPGKDATGECCLPLFAHPRPLSAMSATISDRTRDASLLLASWFYCLAAHSNAFSLMVVLTQSIGMRRGFNHLQHSGDFCCPLAHEHLWFSLLQSLPSSLPRSWSNLHRYCVVAECALYPEEPECVGVPQMSPEDWKLWSWEPECSGPAANPQCAWDAEAELAFWTCA